MQRSRGTACSYAPFESRRCAGRHPVRCFVSRVRVTDGRTRRPVGCPFGFACGSSWFVDVAGRQLLFLSHRSGCTRPGVRSSAVWRRGTRPGSRRGPPPPCAGGCAHVRLPLRSGEPGEFHGSRVSASPGRESRDRVRRALGPHRLTYGMSCTTDLAQCRSTIRRSRERGERCGRSDRGRAAERRPGLGGGVGRIGGGGRGDRKSVV